MLRAWRNELLCVGGLCLVLLLIAVFAGHTQALLGGGLIAYLGWHLYNFVLLQRWVIRGRRSRLPVSLGVWEGIFDGLQRRQLQERRRRRAAARSNSDIRATAMRLPDALAVLDQDNRVLWFNAAAEKLLALRRPRDLGQDITHLVPCPGLEDSLAGVGSWRPLEIASPANNGKMLSVQTTGSFGPSRQRMLVARDITPYHRLERARRDFVANVSHELRTPITVFRGYLDAIRDGDAAPGWARPVAAMDEQAQRMHDLIDDLLTLSRLELAGRSEPTDIVRVAEMLESIVEEARTLSGGNRHQLFLTADPDIRVRGRKEELRSAFSNLVFNAVRHTPPGTRIEVSWASEQDYVVLTVRDFGQGIAARHLPRLTERFYRVDSSRSRESGGTGLGLAIVKQVLERCDADLTIASEPGRGSTFGCRFPRSRVEVRPANRPFREYAFGA